MNIKKQFRDGLITNNPVLVQLLGMCSTMAITTMFFNGIGMGISVLIILTCCNVVISAMRKVIPNDIRIAVFVVIIAGFVTIVDLLLQAYVPALSESLGVFIPLIVVNCIIIGRAEAFAAKNTIGASALDGIFQGLGYTIVLTIMCVIREFLGSGSFGKGIINTISGIGRLLRIISISSYLFSLRHNIAVFCNHVVMFVSHIVSFAVYCFLAGFSVLLASQCYFCTFLSLRCAFAGNLKIINNLQSILSRFFSSLRISVCILCCQSSTNKMLLAISLNLDYIGSKINIYCFTHLNTSPTINLCGLTNSISMPDTISLTAKS